MTLDIPKSNVCNKEHVQMAAIHCCLQYNILRFVVIFNYNSIHVPYFKAYIAICLCVMLMIGVESYKT
jgi:hypothetical protein